MPQTSPMNWIVLSMTSITSIMYIISSLNEKVNPHIVKKMKFNLTMKSWNW